MWEALGAGLTTWSGGVGAPAASSLAVYDEGSGPSLIVGGGFINAGGQSARTAARWRGGVWASVGGGLWGELPGCIDCGFFIEDLTVVDMGGPQLVATGTFVYADRGNTVNSIASWNGTQWQPLGSGLTPNHPLFPTGISLGAFDDGSGEMLYVGGMFAEAGGVPMSFIARWDGTQWSDVGGGVSPTSVQSVSAMAVFDDGNGESLYVGGSFDGVGEPRQAVSSLARWDGTAWHDVGGGVTTAAGEPGHVDAMAIFDDGNGPALYVGGVFEFAGGVPAKNIARWDGQQWSALGLGLDDGVRALTVYDLGDGEALYIGGDFLNAGGMPSAHIAKWVGCKEPCPACVCDFDTTTGPQVCDIFDFLTFQNGFVTADPCAINLDTTTGPNIPDIFDFLAFQNAFVAGCP